MSNDSYVGDSRLSKNDWVTDPEIVDPDNLPEPLGWTLRVRPYPIREETQGGLLLGSEDIDYMHSVLNIGRIVGIGKSAFNRPHHRDVKGDQYDWVQVGDFISYPKHVGSKRKFKGISYIVLNDDEIDERLIDPLIFPEEGLYQINIPEDHLKKYNTIYNEEYMKGLK